MTDTLLQSVKDYTRTQLEGKEGAIADVLALVRSLSQIGPLAADASHVDITLSNFQRKAEAWLAENPAPEEEA